MASYPFIARRTLENRGPWWRKKQHTKPQKEVWYLEELLIVGLDKIALALNPGRDLGKRTVRKSDREKRGLPAEQIDGKGAMGGQL